MTPLEIGIERNLAILGTDSVVILAYTPQQVFGVGHQTSCPSQDCSLAVLSLWTLIIFLDSVLFTNHLTIAPIRCMAEILNCHLTITPIKCMADIHNNGHLIIAL